ncbi:hypothetical protein DY000_02024990 [Brassica cretica]|uniref:Uncharacterized protein n=1 Tax=Brassica cretica TaxID=69181 RepID=A0ABQ7ED37_BRACR|nr:hypothetical protein DY000_02024990 [Brassica cretica]
MVNEVLVSRISPKDEGAVKIADSVPLFHSNLALFRPLEVSLIMVTLTTCSPCGFLVNVS